MNRNTLTTPPHNVEAEEALLGSILIDADMLREVHLTPAVFYIKRHGFVWQAFLNLQAADMPVDLLTVQEELNKAGQLQEVGGPAYITRLCTLVPSAFNAPAYARLVHETYERRNLIAAASAVAKLAYDDAREIEAVKTDSVRAINDATLGSLRDSLQPVAGPAADLMDDVMGDTLGKYLLPLFEPLTSNIGGLDIDTFTLVAGRPGMAKTSLLLQVADVVSAAGGVVAFGSKEMSLRQCLLRLACRRAHVSPQSLRTGQASYDERKLVADWLAHFSDRKTLFIDEKKSQTTGEFKAECHKVKRRMGQLDLVLGDHLRLFANRPDLSEVLRLGDISRDCKVIAGELQTRTMFTCQLNRGIEGRPEDDRRPTMSDIRGSGQIEEDADNILGLYRPDYYNKNGLDKSVEILNLKFRDGDANAVTRMNFEAAYMSFERIIQ